MKTFTLLNHHVLVLVFAIFCAPGQLLGADNDKQNKENHNDQSDVHSGDTYSNFDNAQKSAVQNYVSQRMLPGQCPPGLAKKNNGCQPPGQVKRWQMGQHLQENVRYQILPADLIDLLGPPQAGYHYGMVDSDILLLMDGTEMVMDAISNLGQ